MRIKRLQILSRTVGMIGLILGSAGVLQAQSNVWTNTVSGKWETATDWSLGAPSSSETVLITNAATKTVTIDGATATNFTSTMTVSNLNLIGSAGTTNILSLTN